MHSLAILLLAATISTAQPILTTTLILRNGTRFDVEGPIREEQGRIIFRTSGSLYSIPLVDVDLDATRAAVTKTVVATNDTGMKFKVSAAERDRLLRALEQNHTGEAATDLKLDRVQQPYESPDKGDEWSWRRAARAHEEAVRRAKEDVELLRARAEALKHQIEQFFSLGYHPNQFTYQSSELQLTLDQIPGAELAVTRAQRDNDQFRDDARRQGITPGWLR
ncbi:MAG TPA: hypothetical protein VNN08_20950 [Thermoanaerobaculia bacterium]|nr:hypothetical protein [Thermoanaerobaculia bacterium]